MHRNGLPDDSPRPLCMLDDPARCPVVAKLRARVEALEWLRGVEGVHYATFWTKQAKDEWRVTLAHARGDAGI